MAKKTRFESDSLLGLIALATDDAEGTIYTKDVAFDHDDTDQVSVKVINGDSQLYFNAYCKGDLYFCGQPQEAAVSNKKKALKGYEVEVQDEE